MTKNIYFKGLTAISWKGITMELGNYMLRTKAEARRAEFADKTAQKEIDRIEGSENIF
jgi:hypothetical protein